MSTCLFHAAQTLKTKAYQASAACDAISNQLLLLLNYAQRFFVFFEPSYAEPL